MPIGTLTKKIHSHESSSVRMPPSSRPNAPPPAAIAPQTPSALVRSGPSAKVVVMIDSAAGETSAPPRPCSAAGGDQHARWWREAVEQRRGREHGDAGDEDPLARRRCRPARPPSSRKPPNSSV